MKANAERIILGKNCVFKPDELHNQNVLVVGPSGSGKSQSVIIPSLLENTSSMIIVDPKGAMKKKFGQYMMQKFQVYELDLCSPQNSQYGFNPLLEIENEQDIVSLADMLVYAAPESRNNKRDPFWDIMAKQMLMIIFEAILICEDDENVNLNAVPKYIDVFNFDSEFAAKLFSGISSESMAFQLWQNFFSFSKAEKTMASIIASLISIIGNWTCNDLKQFFKKESFDIIDFMKRPSILFLKIADVDESNYALTNFMINYFINRLFKYSDMQEDGRGKIPVKIVLEDYASGIFFQNLYRYICTGRERMISFIIVIQSLAQLEACHAQNAKTILSNIDYWVVFSTTEITTARELLSQRLEIPLAEALAFPINKVAVFVRGRSPIITERYDISEHENYDKWMRTEKKACHKE